MKKTIIREFITRLAAAPETVITDLINELTGADREAAERLAKALNIIK